MRILVVTNMYPTPERPRRGVFVKRQVEALENGGHEVQVIHLDTATSRYAYARGVGRVRAAERSWSPDVVHVHFGMSLVAAVLCRSPVVVTYHGSDLAVGWKRFLSLTFSPKASARVVVAPQMREALGRPEVHVIPCGVAVEELPGALDRSAARTRLDIGPETLLLFPSSPARPEKRYGLFLEAASKLPDIAVATLDEVEPSEVPWWLTAADCVVLTSAHEGSPVVTKESLCCGSRVVSVDVGDVHEQVEGFSGCRIVEADAEKIAAGVREALAEARPDATRARELFNTAREAEALTRLYASVLRGGRR